MKIKKIIKIKILRSRTQIITWDIITVLKKTKKRLLWAHMYFSLASKPWKWNFRTLGIMAGNLWWTNYLESLHFFVGEVGANNYKLRYF